MQEEQDNKQLCMVTCAVLSHMVHLLVSKEQLPVEKLLYLEDFWIFHLCDILLKSVQKIHKNINSRSKYRWFFHKYFELQTCIQKKRGKLWPPVYILIKKYNEQSLKCSLRKLSTVSYTVDRY